MMFIQGEGRKLLNFQIHTIRNLIFIIYAEFWRRTRTSIIRSTEIFMLTVLPPCQVAVLSLRKVHLNFFDFGHSHSKKYLCFDFPNCLVVL